jgi:hypothetical protein
MTAVARHRIREMGFLMGASPVPKIGRPRAPRRKWYEMAERALRGDISERQAALIYGVSRRTVRDRIAWCLAPANDDPRADRCRALAGRRG